MGRSFARLQPEHVPEFGKPFHHQASDSYFAMVARDGKYYQRRWQIGFDGKETNVDEKQVDFVIGSGNHSYHLSSSHQPRRASGPAPELVFRKGRLLGHEPRVRSAGLSWLGSPRALRVHVLPQRLSQDSRGARTCRQRGDDLSRSPSRRHRLPAMSWAGAAARRSRFRGRWRRGANSGRHCQPEAPGARSGARGMHAMPPRDHQPGSSALHPPV